MKAFQNIMACLDLTDIDRHIISYASFLARLFPVEKLFFIHVLQPYDVPDEEYESWEEVEKRVEAHLQEDVYKYAGEEALKDNRVELIVESGEQDASDVIIDEVRERKIDLTILGKRGQKGRKERYSGRVIALAESNILMVPHAAEGKLQHILMAIDFTSRSEACFELAAHVAKEVGAQVSCKYIYSLPKFYFPLTSRQALYRRIARNARDKADRFMNKYRQMLPDITCYTTPAPYEKQAEGIIETAKSIQANMIMVGAHGRTSQPAALLGFISEKLREASTDLPVLIVKNPFEKDSFWNVLFHG